MQEYILWNPPFPAVETVMISSCSVVQIHVICLKAKIYCEASTCWEDLPSCCNFRPCFQQIWISKNNIDVKRIEWFEDIGDAMWEIWKNLLPKAKLDIPSGWMFSDALWEIWESLLLPTAKWDIPSDWMMWTYWWWIMGDFSVDFIFPR